MPGGTLYVVATPLGNLGDLSARAAELLRRVPVVAAEDTRRTSRLLAHLEARPRLVAYHAHSRARVTTSLLELLHAGQDVALVSDAGTPGISDPGAALVAEVRRAGLGVVPLPGPSAVTTALSVAGLPADRYVFFGFLPRKGAERARLLERLGREEWTCVVFEAPGRLGELLGDLAETCGSGRPVLVARELTKLHEEIRSGTLEELLTSGPAAAAERGEYTVVIAGAPPGPEAPRLDRAGVERAAARLVAAGISRKEAAGLLAELFGLSRNEAYRMVAERGEE